MSSPSQCPLHGGGYRPGWLVPPLSCYTGSEMRKKKHKRTDFAEALVRTRRERGCPSAYGFFHGNGGRKRFGFTYPYYLLIEQGARLPSARHLGRILEL